MTQAKPEVTIIVQSHDRFADCWPPFFQLFKKYWPACPYPIVLNTETRDYAHPGLNIRSAKTGPKSQTGNPGWSEGLLLCLNDIDSDLVLFTLDDFFMSGPVITEAFHRCVEAMKSKPISNITLTEHGTGRPTEDIGDPLFRSVRRDAKYRLSTAIALWNKKSLQGYLRACENPWQFEIFGSWRARRRDDVFLTIDHDKLDNGGEGVIPYFQAAYDTGIVKGQWQTEIESFFRHEGIDIDFSKRGWFTPPPRWKAKSAIVRKLLQNPLSCLLGIGGPRVERRA